MSTGRSPTRTWKILPLTPDRWADLEKLFGTRGACGGCWCMWFRIPRTVWKAAKGEGNRLAFQAYVKSGRVPGLLAYERGVPVGWVAIEPRDSYPRLEGSRNLARVDEVPVWSITCFYVSRSHRNRGLTRALVDAAVTYARTRGVPAIEGYPVDYTKKVGDAFAYTGAASVFRAAGFEEVARRSPTRPIYRMRLSGSRRNRRGVQHIQDR